MLIRPVEERDLDQLHHLAQLTTYGLTTLPKDRATFEKRVRQSLRAFADLNDADPQGQLYLFVMEDTSLSRVVGTCGIVSKVGGFKPFYAFRLKKENQQSKILGSRHEHRVLHLVKNHDGPTEVGSLFLHPEFRGGGNGRVLSLSRFLFLAEYPHLFEREVIAEMRGVVDETGQSPFWEALGVHFFGIDFPNADMLSLINKDFIEELIPQHPVYLDLLSPDAQSSVGQVHSNTIPARRLLETEGFVFDHFIDIFEGGPVLHCPRREIRTVKQSRVLPVVSVQSSLRSNSIMAVVSAKEDYFRVSGGKVIEEDTGLVLDAQLAKDLQVEVGKVVRFAPVKATS